MGRVKEFLKRKAASAVAERIVPWPLGKVVALLPERARLPAVTITFVTLLGTGMAWRFSRGEPILGAGKTDSD